MVAYLIRRTLVALLIVVLASVVIFLLMDGLTRSYGGIMRGEMAFGPAHERYAAWIGELARGELGVSAFGERSVNEIVGEKLWPTVLLMGASLTVTVAFAIPFGIYSAIRRHGPLDNAGRTFFFVGYSMPGFWLGAMLQLVLGVYLTLWSGTRIFYVAGMTQPDGGGLLDLLRHLTLPVIALSLAGIAQFVRFQRGAMLEALASDYVKTARAKGLPARAVHLKHAFRNALIPTVTLLALSVGAVAGGAVVIEAIFGWPGLGFLLINSLISGDYEIVRALLMINALLIILCNLIADLSYAFLDPRVGDKR